MCSSPPPHGTVKKTPLSEYSRPRASGIIAIDLRDGDQLVNVALTHGQRDVMLFTNAGKALRFTETEVRNMGRSACGVRGIRLGEGQKVIALIVVEEGTVLTVDRKWLRQAHPSRRLSASWPWRAGRHCHSDFGTQRPGDRRSAGGK
jgi:DNA gyrase/topoisomerase IV subunit A